MRSCLEYLIKHNAFVQLCYRKIVSAFFKILGCFIKTDPKLVLLTSMSGDQYNDSPRVLFKAMLKDDYFKTYHYIWAFKNPEKFNVPHAETIKIDTMRYFIVALKAKIWITNVNIERGLDFKKKNTIYLNTWHG
ncbi:MAG TPA: CDP-glycerol--glycerophosphate glycerophosphotransferase, partial [Lachnospiraceae bacterium]|nr:CDP-glycerol--glycerophosphate glycerophosphotransferase [Lachnospiraceae bacterium]